MNLHLQTYGRASRFTNWGQPSHYDSYHQLKPTRTGRFQLQAFALSSNELFLPSTRGRITVESLVMTYVSLLSTVVRLLDLHDSQRALGALPNYTEEQRPGNRDGVYLEIATAILEALKVVDDTTPGDYLSFEGLVQIVRSRRADCLEQDVQYVLNVLRRPTELIYLTQSSASDEKRLVAEKRRTALVERTDYADEFRLTASGRLLFSLATSAQDAAYLRGDTLNLLHAIDWGHFDKVYGFATDIAGRLRNEVLDIRMALEQIGRIERLDHYLPRIEQYQRVVKGAMDTLEQAEHALLSPATFTRFEVWQETTTADLTFEQIEQSMVRVRQVLVIFTRLISELITVSLQGTRTATPPPQFLDFAAHFVRLPDSQHLEFVLTQWCACGLVVPVHSVMDGWAAVRNRQAATVPDPLTFHDESIEPASRLGHLEFLGRYGADIAAALKQGPLKLSDAVRAGWVRVKDRVKVGELVGVFAMPDALPLTGELLVGLGETFTRSVFDHGEWLFSELEMTWLGERHEQ